METTETDISYPTITRGELVYDVEYARASTVGELIRNEIHRPTLVDCLRHLNRLPSSQQLLASLGADLQSFFSVDPIGPRAVDDQALGFEKAMQDQINVSGLLSSQLYFIPAYCYASCKGASGDSELVADVIGLGAGNMLIEALMICSSVYLDIFMLRSP